MKWPRVIVQAAPPCRKHLLLGVAELVRVLAVTDRHSLTSHEVCYGPVFLPLAFYCAARNVSGRVEPKNR